MAETTKDIQRLTERLNLDPESDLGIWVKQQVEAGVADDAILASIARAGNITPAKFVRVPYKTSKAKK